MRSCCAMLLAAGLTAVDGEIPDRVLVHRLLAARCIACHGPERSDAGLRLDRPLDLLLLVTPGKPERSRIIDLARLPTGDPMLMPPPSAGPRLDVSELDLLRRWIAAGALPPVER